VRPVGQQRNKNITLGGIDMITIQNITEYLTEYISDPIPNYIVTKEIINKPPVSKAYITAYENMTKSKWYRILADEQNENGSWGSGFHGMLNNVTSKFNDTENGLYRARSLSLTKDDPVVAKCIGYMERTIRGDDIYPDRIEKHKDNGKGHLFCRPFMLAANINMFDPENPVIQPLRDVVVETMGTVFANGVFDEVFWNKKEEEYHVPGIVHPENMYSLMLLQKANCMDDNLQRQYLKHIWGKPIYYVSRFPVCEIKKLEDRDFYSWIYTLECLSGFSLFHEFVKENALPHLLNEVERLMTVQDITMTAPMLHHARYAEDWRDKNKRKTDIILRIAKLLAKC